MPLKREAASPTRSLSNLIFKAKPVKMTGNFSLTPEMLAVLPELDGSKDVQTIAENTSITIRNLRAILDRLYKLNLIEKIEKVIPALSPDFMPYLEAQLADAVGPIAKILIKDAIHYLGEDPHAIPYYREGELIDLIASKIYLKDKKEAFLKVMKAKPGIKK